MLRLTLQLPYFWQSPLTMHCLLSALHVPLMSGHCAFDVHEAPVAVHLPALGQSVELMHVPPVSEHEPAIVEQSALVVHALLVCTLQLPTSGQFCFRVHAPHS